MNYETHKRKMSDNDYLKVELEDNSPEMLSNIKNLLEAIPTVKRCNITTGFNRDNLTVYPTKFTPIEKMDRDIQKELNKY